MEADGGSLSCFRSQMAMAYAEEFDDPELFHLIEESMWPRLAEFRTGTRTFRTGGVLRKERVMGSRAILEVRQRQCEGEGLQEAATAPTWRWRGRLRSVAPTRPLLPERGMLSRRVRWCPLVRASVGVKIKRD